MLQREPHCPEFGKRLEGMTVVHYAARDVDVRDRIAVEQQVLLYGVEEERRDGKRAEQQRESRIVTLLAKGTRTPFGTRSSEGLFNRL